MQQKKGCTIFTLFRISRFKNLLCTLVSNFTQNNKFVFYSICSTQHILFTRSPKNHQLLVIYGIFLKRWIMITCDLWPPYVIIDLRRYKVSYSHIEWKIMIRDSDKVKLFYFYPSYVSDIILDHQELNFLLSWIKLFTYDVDWMNIIKS